MKEYCIVSKKSDRTISGSRNSCLQRLNRYQHGFVESYKLTDSFKMKHIEENASRKDVLAKASERRVTRSTLIRLSAKAIEEKALSICQHGDNDQVAATKNSQYGVQLHVRLPNIPIATYNSESDEYERNESGQFIIVGTWKKDCCEGNHFEGNYDNLPANDEELIPEK